MFHPDTQFLIDHWTALANRPGAQSGVPDRTALQPDALGLRLPRMFMADIAVAPATLRVVGGWIEAFHDRPLKGIRFISLFSQSSADIASAALDRARTEARPVVLATLAGPRDTAVELALVPLRGAQGRITRVLGLYAPSETLTFGRTDSRLLTARASIGVGPVGRPTLSLASAYGRRVA